MVLFVKCKICKGLSSVVVPREEGYQDASLSPGTSNYFLNVPSQFAPPERLQTLEITMEQISIRSSLGTKAAGRRMNCKGDVYLLWVKFILWIFINFVPCYSGDSTYNQNTITWIVRSESYTNKNAAAEDRNIKYEVTIKENEVNL